MAAVLRLTATSGSSQLREVHDEPNAYADLFSEKDGKSDEVYNKLKKEPDWHNSPQIYNKVLFNLVQLYAATQEYHPKVDQTHVHVGINNYQGTKENAPAPTMAYLMNSVRWKEQQRADDVRAY